MTMRLKLIKWTVLLCAGLFCSMLVLGQDQGQQRLGLTGGRDIQATRNVVAPVATTTKADEPLAKTRVTLAFAPVEPLIAPTGVAPDVALDDAASASAPEFPVMYVKSDRANLRAGPGKEFDVRGKMARGQPVEVVSAGLGGGDWALVRTKGARGFVSASLLTEKQP